MVWGNNTLARPGDYVVPGDASGSGPPNVFMEGVAPSFQWTLNGSRASSTYEVIDTFTGAVVETGSAASSPLVLTASYPPGAYTLHIKRASAIADWGFAQGQTFFVVWRASSNLHDNNTLRYSDNETQPMVRGAIGGGTTRYTISNAEAPTTGEFTLANAQAQIALNATWNPADANRPAIKPVLSFRGYVNGVVLQTNGATAGSFTFTIGGQTATIPFNANAASVASLIGALSSIGSTHVQAYCPGTGINTSFVKVWFDGATNTPNLQAPNATVNGSGLTGGSLTALYEVNGVQSCVSTLGTSVVYEATNEPGGAGFTGAGFVYLQKLFHDQIKAINSSAQVIGPCWITAGEGNTGIHDFLAAGGGAYVDALSFHLYNMVNGDSAIARPVMDAFAVTLASNSFTKPLYMTEWGQFAWYFGLYDPGLQARWTMTMYLILEQYGIPKERVNYFFDLNPAFTSYPSWLMAGAGMLGCSPTVNLLRVYSDEIYGKTHAARLSFGGDEDYIVGSRFDHPSDGTKVIVLISLGCTDQNVTLNVTGAVSLTKVAPHGVTSTVSVVSGQITVALSNGVPTYIRIPNGTTVTVATPSYGTDKALSATAFSSGTGSGISKINDGTRRSYYITLSGDYIHGANAPYIDDRIASTRTVAVTTNFTDIISFASGDITSADIGYDFSGTGIAADTVIRDIVDTTHAQLNSPASNGTAITATITQGLPTQIGLQWGSAQILDRVTIECPPPWQAQGTLRTFSLKYSLGAGSPITLSSVNESAKSQPWRADHDFGGGASQAESYFSGRCVFTFTFAPITADKIWIDVSDCTIGGCVDPVALIGGELGLRRPVIRRIQAFHTGSSPVAPNPPGIGTATAGNTTATINWTTPVSDGGSAITGYVVKLYRASDNVELGSHTTGVILIYQFTGQTNGVPVYGKVAAVNAFGTSAESSASNTVTPTAGSTVPGIPTIGAATASNTSATARWTTPISDGGSPITGYFVQTFRASDSTLLAVDTTGVVLSFTRTGLTNGIGVYFQVSAINLLGTGVASGISNIVIPNSIPTKYLVK